MMSPESGQPREDGGAAARAGDPSLGETSPALPLPIQAHIGAQLRGLYAALLTEPQPTRLLDLIAALDVALAADSERAAAAAGVFKRDLLAALPRLRAFAFSLTAAAAQADDLVQDTVLKAWQNQHRFEPGTNLLGWLTTILRNEFYTTLRKRRREVEDADGTLAGQLIALPDQEAGIELRQIWAKLSALPASQREALLLVGAQGFTYEAAAELMGCQVGTVKSRVSRGRALLNAQAGRP